jgi:hypothetical protein
MVKEVVCFYSVFDKVGVAHCIKRHIVNNSKVVHAVYCYCSVVALVYRVASNVRLANTADHVEINWVTTEFVSLPYICELDILDSANARLIAW